MYVTRESDMREYAVKTTSLSIVDARSFCRHWFAFKHFWNKNTSNKVSNVWRLPARMEERLRAAPKTRGTTTHTKDERHDRLVWGTDAEWVRTTGAMTRPMTFWGLYLIMTPSSHTFIFLRNKMGKIMQLNITYLCTVSK